MKNLIIYCILCLVFAVFIGLTSCLTIESNQTSSPLAPARVLISILDENNLPIIDATVCIVETSEYHQTNRLGQTEKIELPTKVIATPGHTPLTKQLETYTILAYKNGYIPHIYHGLKVQPNITKTGVVITLVERSKYTGIEFTESFEFPPTETSLEIIRRHKK